MDTYNASKEEAQARIDELSEHPVSEISEAGRDENENNDKRCEHQDVGAFEDVFLTRCTKNGKDTQHTAQATSKVKPAIATLEVTKKRYQDFIRLLHRCCAEKPHSQSVEIDAVRSFFAKKGRDEDFMDDEINACIDRMAEEDKVLRSGDTVFFI